MIVGDPRPGYPRQIWFVLAMAAVLVAILAGGLLGGEGHPPDDPVHHSANAPAATAPPTRAAGVQTTASRPRTRTEPSPTPSPLPPSHEDHYWLERPIAADKNDSVARFYPYASRGDGTYPVHHGVEFVNPSGTQILAVAAGEIMVAGNDYRQVWGARTGFYGQVVIERLHKTLNGRPVYVLYAHLATIEVQPGQQVDTGDPIGRVGMTGVAEGPHLHFEVRYGENSYHSTVNPELWLLPHDGTGTLAGKVVSADGAPIPEAQVLIYRIDNLNVPLRALNTYPAREVNPDPAWGEGFATGGLSAGEYVVHAYHRQRQYAQTVVVDAGSTVFVTITVGR